MHDYTEQRLEELRNMSTKDVAASKIRKTTPPRVKAMILQAREKTEDKKGHGGGDGEDKPKDAPPKKLKSGDVLLMHKRRTLPQRIISCVTGSPYTHAALVSKGKVYDALSPTLGRRYAGGNVNTLKEFAERDKGVTYDVFRPRDKEMAGEAARNAERLTLNTKGYSFANLVQAGMKDRFGYGITINYDKNYKICSELVYDCFNGYLGNDVSSSVTPGRLAKNQHLEKVDTLRLSIEELLEKEVGDSR
jgi:hypothetical protein